MTDRHARRIFDNTASKGDLMRWIRKFLLFEKHTCPWWMACAWDHRLRRWFHDTHVILKPYLSAGDRVADIGCGMGYFSIAMADCVGPCGNVFAVDLQQQMLDVLNRRARKQDAGDRIQTVLAGSEDKYIDGPLDFILMFWMLHEVDDKAAFLGTWNSRLKEGGTYIANVWPCRAWKRFLRRHRW
jgi:ubiquinone/menaquinone biosynthesis C-methylase UbiE